MKKKNLLKFKKNLLLASLILGTSFTGVNLNNTNCYAMEKTINDEDSNKPKSIDESIEYYSKVFELDSKKVHDKLYDMTNDFNDYGWKYAYAINGNTYDNYEMAILDTIRDIYNNPEDFDLDESIRSGEAYETDMEIEEMIYKYSSLYGINKEVALSIVYCECGTSVNSDNYLYNNNPAGIGPNMHFLNKEVGVIYFCNMLKNNYGCKKDSGEGFLNSIASTYCEIPGHWLDLTLPNYYKLQEDYLSFVPEDEKKNYDIESYEENQTYKLK